MGAVAESAGAARAIYATIGAAAADEAQKRLEHLRDYVSATDVPTQDYGGGDGGKAARGGGAGHADRGRGTGHKAAIELAREEAKVAKGDRREEHLAHAHRRRRLREQSGRPHAPDPAPQPAAGTGIEAAGQHARLAGKLDAVGDTGSSATAAAQPGGASLRTAAAGRTARRDAAAHTAGGAFNAKASTSEPVHNGPSRDVTRPLHSTRAARLAASSVHGGAPGHVAEALDSGTSPHPPVETLDEPDPDADPGVLHGARAAAPDAHHLHRQKSAVQGEAAARLARTRSAEQLGSAAGNGSTLFSSTDEPAGAGPPLADPDAGSAALEPRRLPMSLSLLSKESNDVMQSAGFDAPDASDGTATQVQSINQSYESLQMEANLARLAAQAVGEPFSQHEEEGIQILTQVRPQSPQLPCCAG